MKKKIPAAIAVAVEFVAFSGFIAPAINFYELGGFIQAIILCIAMGVMSATWKYITGSWQNVKSQEKDASAQDRPQSKKKTIVRIVVVLWLLGGLIYIFWGASWKDIGSATFGVPVKSECMQAQNANPSRSCYKLQKQIADVDQSRKKEDSSWLKNLSDDELEHIVYGDKREQKASSKFDMAVAKAENDMLATFINGASLHDALDLHGEEVDPELKDYSLSGKRSFAKAKGSSTRYATDVLILYAELAGLTASDIETAKAVSQGDPYKMYDFFQQVAERQLEDH